MTSQKILTFALFSILAVFLFAGLASATTNLQATVTDITVNHDAGSATFTVALTNEGAADTITM